MSLASKLFKGDRAIWIVFMLFCVISIIEVFSATSILAYKHNDYWSPIIRHSQMLFVGLVVVLFVQNIPYRFFTVGILLLPLSLLLLVFTYIWGVEINGSSRWLNIFGFRFQPSEIAKLSNLILMAYLMSSKKLSDAKKFKYILICIISICGLIFPENFSTSIMIFGFSFVMMFIGQISLKRLGGLFLVCTLLSALFIASLFTVQSKYINKYDILVKIKHRLESHFEPKSELNPKTYIIDDENRQASYAKIAIANGGIGKFPGLGQQRDSLPQAYSDFIYAIIIEEMGITGGILVMLLYIIILFRAGMIARKCEKLFPKYLVLGCGLLIGIQAFANMAVVVGMLPVTGQPLPLISRGGTSTIITCVYIGIILSVSRFGAGIGNEEDEEEEADDIVEIETNISEENPLTVIEE